MIRTITCITRVAGAVEDWEGMLVECQEVLHRIIQVRVLFHPWGIMGIDRIRPLTVNNNNLITVLVVTMLTEEGEE